MNWTFHISQLVFKERISALNVAVANSKYDSSSHNNDSGSTLSQCSWPCT